MNRTARMSKIRMSKIRTKFCLVFQTEHSDFGHLLYYRSFIFMLKWSSLQVFDCIFRSKTLRRRLNLRLFEVLWRPICKLLLSNSKQKNGCNNIKLAMLQRKLVWQRRMSWQILNKLVKVQAKQRLESHLGKKQLN